MQWVRDVTTTDPQHRPSFLLRREISDGPQNHCKQRLFTSVRKLFVGSAGPVAIFHSLAFRAAGHWSWEASVMHFVSCFINFTIRGAAQVTGRRDRPARRPSGAG